MDSIANLLTSIRNGYLAHKEEVVAPYSRVKENIVKILASQGFVASYQKTKDTPAKLEIKLHYFNDQPLLTHIERISKPGVRKYVNASQIETAKSGAGISIISTSKGLMTDKEAKAANLGGEIICKVW